MEETKRLYRSCKDKILGGVAGGLGEYFGIDPTIIRLIIVLLVFSGFGVLAYLIAWIVIPLDPSCETKKTASDEIKESAEKFASSVKDAVNDTSTKKNNKTNDAKFWVGIVIVALGTMFIFQNLLGLNFWSNFWPLILISVGIVIIAKSVDKR
jgi:phage shock protein C